MFVLYKWLSGTSLAENLKCWNLEFHQAEIFADNLVILADNFLNFSSLISINVDKHKNIAQICLQINTYFP